jgi:hypothetical protein
MMAKNEAMAVNETDSPSLIAVEIMKIPMDRKAAYEEACAQHPHLVHMESNAAVFSRFARESSEAAVLLTEYWNRRKSIFTGRAFLPILPSSSAQNFGEAINAEDVAFLKGGTIQLLPSNTKGKGVMFIDPGNRKGCDVQGVLRIMFVLMQKLVGRESSDIMIILLIRDQFSTKESDIVKNCCDLLKSAMPLEMRRLHVVSYDDQPIPSMAYTTADDLLRNDLAKEAVFIKAESAVEMLTRLGHYGFTAHSLPPAVGGEFQWDPLKQLLSESHGSASQKTAPPARKRKATFDSNLDEGSTSERAQELQPLYLKDFSEDSKPRAENRAQGLLDSADTQVRDRYRTRNAVYSRRKYVRKKIEHEVLETECGRLQTENTDLTLEGKRLEGLLRDAIQQVNAQETLANSMSGVGRLHPDFRRNREAMLTGIGAKHPVLGQHHLSDSALLALSQARLHDRMVAHSASAAMGYRPSTQHIRQPQAGLASMLSGFPNILPQHFPMALPQLFDSRRMGLPAPFNPVASSLPTPSRGIDTTQFTEAELRRFLLLGPLPDGRRRQGPS